MKPEFIARIPATSANLGPGFDCMGLAIDLYNEFCVTPDSKFEITVSGVASGDISLDQDNLVIQAASVLLNHVGSKISPLSWQIEITTSIPSASGLGSSASAIAAGMLLANAIVGFYEPERELSRAQVVELATAMEGHPDNVTPALLGGAWVSLYHHGQLQSFDLGLPRQLVFCVASPKVQVATDESRRALAPSVTRMDAVYNVAQTARLVIALERGNLGLLEHTFGDRLHEPYRTHLIPHYAEVFHEAQLAGAAAVTLSGSGPTLLTWCDGGEVAARVKDAILTTWSNFGVDGRVDIYKPVATAPTVEIVQMKEAKL